MKITFIILLVLFLGRLQAQDSHFSQFEQTKSLLNPALISYQPKDYLFQLQRRSQWQSVTTPFNTLSLSFIAKNFFNGLSAGAALLDDIAGDSRFSTKGLIFSLANPVFTVQDNIVSIGVQTSFYERSINYDELLFLETEYFEISKINFFDIGLGLSSHKVFTKKSSLLLGFSIYHLNRPTQSLSLGAHALLPQKFIFHSRYYMSLNPKIDFSPKIYFSSQSTDMELIIGSGFSYKLTNDINLRSGLYSRLNDAIFVTLGMQKSNFDVIVSYDINTSTLASASNYMGAFEFSISYSWSVIRDEKELKNNLVCPKYL